MSNQKGELHCPRIKITEINERGGGGRGGGRRKAVGEGGIREIFTEEQGEENVLRKNGGEEIFTKEQRGRRE